VRRLVVVAVVLVLACTLWPAIHALAQGSPAASVTAGGRLRADFNNDGFADLAVGVPAEDVGGMTDAGAVNVLYGSASGLSGAGSQLFTQDTPGVGSSSEGFDEFGLALAAGDFNHDGFADLAVGVPGEDAGTVGFAGAVNVLYGSAAGLSGAGSQRFTQDTPGVGSSAEAGDSFGRVLTVGDFNGDGVADLAVSVPGENVGSILFAGAVNVLYGSVAGLTGAGSQLFTQDTPGVGSSAEASDQFGFALAAGDYNHDGAADLAIGMIFESVGSNAEAGGVNVLYGSAAGLSGAGSQFLTQNTPGVPDFVETGDQFGAVLAAGDFNHDGAADLAVGVRFEDVGSILDAGAVNLLYGSVAGLTGTGSQLFTQNTPGVGSSAEPRDAFGSALTAGDFNHDGAADLVVGVPFEDVGSILDAGAVNLLYGSASGLTAAGSQLFTQDTPGVGSNAEDFDRFGSVLAASGP
jgi:hypothetical protein